MRRPPLALTALTAAVAVAASGGLAAAEASHDGWPEIDGVLKMHKNDQSVAMRGTADNDELLGGHGNDTIWGRGGHDVIWGDYKPGGQPGGQVDHLHGGAGNEFIYASHGRNVIDAGAGSDTIHAHFGRGSIDCGTGRDLLYVSHRSRKTYKISGCERISYKTQGY